MLCTVFHLGGELFWMALHGCVQLHQALCVFTEHRLKNLHKSLVVGIHECRHAPPAFRKVVRVTSVDAVLLSHRVSHRLGEHPVTSAESVDGLLGIAHPVAFPHHPSQCQENLHLDG